MDSTILFNIRVVFSLHFCFPNLSSHGDQKLKKGHMYTLYKCDCISYTIRNCFSSSYSHNLLYVQDKLSIFICLLANKYGHDFLDLQYKNAYIDLNISFEKVLD